MHNHIDAARLLLQKGVEIDAIPPGFDYAGTGLHNAAVNGHRAIVDFLIEQGANVNINSDSAKAMSTDATPLRLFQGIESGSNFLVSRTLAVIRFHLCPGNLSCFVNHINRRMRDTVKLLAFVGRIVQAIRVDNLMIRVGEDRVVNFAFTVRGNLLSKVLANIRRVYADRVELDVLVLLQQRPQCG